nr:putative late blight resistance protein homolog R1A-4 [Ipomoea batatas]
MAYAAVTSLMETLSLNFLQSQPGLPLEDLEAQIRVGNENLGLLQQILEKSENGNDDAEAEMGLDEASSSSDYYPKQKKKKKLIKSEKLQQLAELEAQIRDEKYENLGVLQQILEAQMREMELDEEASSKRLGIKACLPRLYGKQRLAWDTILLTSRLREMAEIKQNIVSLHQNLGLLQQSLEKSEIPYDDAVMKDLEAQIRDASFKAEERIEMELTPIYLAKDSLHITACLLRLHQIFIEAQKRTDHHRNELIRIQTDEYQLEALSIRRWYCLEHIPCSGIPWATSFLPNLKKLKFFETRLPWSDMKLIGMLPNLEVLKLIDASEDREWETSEEGFRRLKWLVIESKYLEYWNAEGDHFPVLECLELHRCYLLQEIPSGFVDITTLALIELNYCEDSLLTSAKWIQDEQLNNYGNSILVRSR